MLPFLKEWPPITNLALSQKIGDIIVISTQLLDLDPLSQWRHEPRAGSTNIFCEGS
jgi:hypothetical protein